MKENFFVFHGTGGYPEENWFPWLKEKLEEKGYEVYVPQFPTPEGQSVKAWLKVLKDYQKYINENTIFIGHSLGGLFLLRLLERIKKPIKAAFIVASPIGVPPINNMERDSAFSGGFHFDWKKIKSNSRYFAIFQSDNDPNVSLGNGQELAKKLGVELTFIPGAGHFNTPSGYITFDTLLNKINSVVI